jgi:hypothetical protein
MINDKDDVLKAMLLHSQDTYTKGFVCGVDACQEMLLEMKKNDKGEYSVFIDLLLIGFEELKTDMQDFVEEESPQMIETLLHEGQMQ